MKKLMRIVALTLILALLATPIAALASSIENARYYGLIQVTNNSTAVTNVATTCNISTTNLINGGYLNSSANNCAIQSSAGADLPFQPSVNFTYPWGLWVPSMGANSIKTDILYTANTTGGKIRYFPGATGMATVDEDVGLEPGDNFTIEQSGWWDTTYSANKRAVYKEDAFQTYISGTENVTSVIANTSFGIIPGDGIALDYVRADNEWTSIPDSDEFSFVTGAVDEPFSLVARVYLKDVVNTQAVVAKYSAAAIEWSMLIADLVTVNTYIPDGSKKVGRTTAANSLDAYLNSWVHLVMTYDGTEASAGFNIYIEGVDADTANSEALPYTNMTNNAAVVSLGATGGGAATNLDGVIAEVKVYSAELTPTEALADYNGGHKTADLVAWYKIDEMAGNPADSSGNGHNATANTAEWVQDTRVTADGVESGEHAITTSGNPAFLGIGEDIGDDTGFPTVTDDLVFNVPLWSTYLEDSPFDSVDANAHTCTVVGATWSYQTGRFFDGTDDEIRATSALFAGTNGTDNKTIEFWVYTPNTTGLGNMLTCRDAGGINYQIYRSTDTARFAYTATGEPSPAWTYEYVVGTWTYVSLSIEGPADRLVLYINGVWEETTILNNFGSDDGGGVLNIGVDTVGGGHANGTFAEVRIYNNKILTPAERLANYDATKWKYIGADTADHFDYVYSGVSVPDTGNDWSFLLNNVMPYMEYHKIWIDGVLQQHIEWEYDTTFTDLSGQNHDATPSFRTASSDADVSAELVSFLPIAEARAPAYVLEEAIPFIEEVPVIVSDFDVSPDPAAGEFPLAGVIATVAAATTRPTPSQLPLVLIAGFTIIGLSLAISGIIRRYGSGTIFVKILVIAGTMGIFVAWGNFGIDFWMIFIFLIMGVALAMASRHVSWQ